MFERLHQALRTEFADVVLHLEQPASFTAPSVVVKPGQPFLEIGTNGTIEEHWHVLVVANKAAADMGVGTMRKLSLKVRRAAHSVGAIWEGTNQPEVLKDESKTLAILTNTVRFRYLPDSVLVEESSSSSSS
jgi:hypothetical protein